MAATCEVQPTDMADTMQVSKDETLASSAPEIAAVVAVAAVEAVPKKTPGPVKRIKKRKKRRETVNAKRQQHISRNGRMNAWKIASLEENYFKKTEYAQLPKRGTPEHARIKKAQLAILDKTWKEACAATAQQHLDWISASDTGCMASIKTADLTETQSKLKEAMKTPEYQKVYVAQQDTLSAILSSRRDDTKKRSTEAFSKALTKYDAEECMKDLPTRSSKKFKKLMEDACFKQRYTNVYTEYRRLLYGEEGTSA